MTKGFKAFAPEGRVTKKASKGLRKPAVRKTPLPKPSGKDLPLLKGSSSQYITTITALKRRDSSDEALYLLQKIASMVSPVMRHHGLKVGTLCEFFPKDPQLLGLNVNHGMKICIRLRPHFNDKTFFPLTELLGTMIHELTHNKHGPHDDKFYTYMGELRRELEDLMAEGFTGDGFFSAGKALGKSNEKSPFSSTGRTLSSGLPTSGIHGLVDPVKLAEARKEREQQQKAADEKKKKPRSKGNRLGGYSMEPDSTLSIRELARRAAERRIQDAKWCGKGDVEISLEELGMDEDVIEIAAPSGSSMPMSMPTQRRRTLREEEEEKSFDVTVLEVIDLTED